MRKSIIIFAICLSLFLVSLPVFGADENFNRQIMTAKITSVVQAVDKNGQPYVRLIVDKQENFQGHKFSVGVPAMAFGSAYEMAKTVTEGTSIKMIVSPREYQGRVSYTIHKIL